MKMNLIMLLVWMTNTARIYPAITVSSGVLREFYKCDTASANILRLIKNPKFPQDPDYYEIIDVVNAPNNFSSTYGERVRGWFLPTKTGTYTFFTSSNDSLYQFYLSSDQNPENRTLFLEQTEKNNLQNRSIVLLQNVRYYTETIIYGNNGIDYLPIGVLLPNEIQGKTPIPIFMFSSIWIDTCISTDCVRSINEKCIFENGSFAVCTCKYGQKILNNAIVCREMERIDSMQGLSIYMKNEVSLVRDSYLATLERILDVFTISFEVKPLSYNGEYRSVLYLIQKDENLITDRYLTVWFKNKSLNIFPAGENLSSSFQYDTPLPLLKWSYVKILQEMVNNNWMYTISLNGDIVYSTLTQNPWSLLNPKVYISDPWNFAQNGSIRNLVIISGTYDSMFLDHEIPLKNNNLLAALNMLHEDFMLKFELKPTLFSAYYTNVLHVTTKVNNQYGDSNPAIYFQSPQIGQVYIVSGINGTVNNSYFSKTFFPLNQWTSIKIVQQSINGIYIYTIALNESTEYSTINTQPAIFNNVYVYASNDLLPEQPGFIRNLNIVSRKKAQWSEWSEWSSCSSVCDVINRTRTCESYWSGCTGNNTELVICKSCCSVVQGEWSAWSTCNTSCGYGEMNRTREYCLINYLDVNIGKDIEIADCFSNSSCESQESVLFDDEIPLVKGKLIAILKNVYKEYMISFQLKPASFDNTTYRHVLHLTANGNNDQYGDRNPLVYFTNRTGSLCISSAINSSKNYVITVKTLSLMEWTLVKISQEFVNQNAIFSVTVNGTLVKSIVNAKPVDLQNVKVYATGPWSSSQNGSIKNLVIISGTYSSMFIDHEIKIKNGTLLTMLNVFYEDFVVSFEVKFTSNTSGNVLHLLDEIQFKNCCVYVDVDKDKLLLYSGINTSNVSDNISQSSMPPINTWTLIKISQHFINSSYRNTVSINQTVVFSTINIQPKVFSSIKVYASNAYSSQGSIRNLYISSKTQAIWSKWSEWSSCNLSCFKNRTRVCSRNQWIDCFGSNIDFMPCNTSYEGSWYMWSPWSTCSIQDGSWFMSRSRSCNDTCENCVGNDTEIIGCSFFESSWGKWSSWSSCNVSYGFGFMNRTRDCNVSNVEQCLGNSTEVKMCFENITCEVSCGKWSSWSSCNVSYGYGFMNRTRDCNVSYNMEWCSGNSIEVIECFENKTFVDVCTQWSQWSLCNVSSGDGFTTRSRMCNTTMGFKWCSSEITDNKYCFETSACTASWGKWSYWSSCNVSYGWGFMNRTRDCNVSNNVEWCSGNSTEIIECFENNTCDDVCTQWSKWSLCNVSCGDGFTTRSRMCNTTMGFEWCSSEITDNKSCFETSGCTEKWTTWTECSVTCGIGNRLSYSLPDTPTNFGMRVENCSKMNCSVDGMWGEWESIACSNTCGSKSMNVKRSCNNPPPANYGLYCMGFSNYNFNCDADQVCPVNGNWSNWSSWSSCSQPCLGGTKFRVRDCSNPTPKYGGLYCEGNSKDAINCHLQNCKSVAVYLSLYFMGEDYVDQDPQKINDSPLKEKIVVAMKNFYNKHKKNVTFNVVLHSVQ